jgi:hypothetical protein
MSWHHRGVNEPQVATTVSGFGTVAAEASVPTPGVVMRAYFSSFYLWSSRHHARLVQEIEQTGTAAHPFPVRHRAYVIESVTDAAFFVEAAINEMLKDVFDNQHEFIGPLDDATKQAWRGYWAGAGKAQAVPKYETALELAGVEPMDHQVSHYGGTKTLFGLRNYLVHFKPEGVSQTFEPSTLAKQTKTLFAGNVLLTGQNNPWFPDHALGAGCAMWAHETAVAFVDDWCSRIGLTLPYQQVQWDEEP